MPRHERPASLNHDRGSRGFSEVDPELAPERQSAPFVSPGGDSVPPSERLDRHTAKRAIASGVFFVVLLAALGIIAFALLMR